MTEAGFKMESKSDEIENRSQTNATNRRAVAPQIEKDRQIETLRRPTGISGAGPAECADPAEALELEDLGV